ncbi:MAG: hypothetical protein M3418_04670 [Gemmatimonadota bacterium]|nr:hypothetical protein [Gemmatimonadota bacterium]
MSESTADLTPDQKARRHLLLSFPDPEIPYSGHEAIDALLRGAIHAHAMETGRGKITLVRELLETIQRLTGLTFEAAEVIAGLERLGGERFLFFKDQRHQSFVVDESAVRQLDSELSATSNRDAKVRNSWLNELRERHEISESEASRLWEGLEQLISDVIATHTAEAAAFLYQDNDDQRLRFQAALAAKYPQIRAFVGQDLLPLAESEYPAFFDPENPSRRDFLADRVQAGFVFHLLNIDPAASELVKMNVSEKVLYLDTNFLYRLLGLQGPALTSAPATTLRISRQLNCTIKVSRATIDEFVGRLRSDISNIPIIRRQEYQRIAADAAGDEWDFARAYYRELASGCVGTKDEFERKYSNVIGFLQEWDVEVDEDAVLTDEEGSSEEFTQAWSALNQWAAKGTRALEHDVFMLRHVRRLRGSAQRTAGQTRVWFLTYDRRLTMFTLRGRRSDAVSPCMLGDSWLQIARPFLPRTDDYEKSFVAMLRYPLLYQSSNAVPFEHVATALSRLERFEPLPIPVVSAMIADGEFIKRLDATQSRSEEAGLVNLAAAAAAGEITKREQRTAAELASAKERLAKLEETLAQTDSARRSAEKAAAAERSLAASAEGRHRDDMDGLEARLKNLVNQAAESAATNAHERGLKRGRVEAEGVQRLTDWVIYFGLAMVITVPSAVWFSVSYVALSPLGRAMIILWWFAAMTLLLGYPMRRRLSGYGIILAIVGIVLALALTTATAWWGSDISSSANEIGSGSGEQP